MRRLAAFIVMAVALTSATPRAQQQERLFRAAMNTELVDGDLRAAIEQYRRVAEGGNRALAAQALVRMAECHQKLGDSEARKIYERLVRDFRDQPEAVAVARTRLGTTPQQGGTGVTLRALPRTDGLVGTVSPDGRYLSFSPWVGGELYIRDLQTGADRVLTRRGDYNIGLSAISRDATRVAYQSYGAGCDARQGGLPALCVVSLNETGLPAAKRVFESQDVLEIAPMDWSPDGRTIVVSLRRQDRTAQIGLVAVADGSLRVLRTVDWRGPLRIAFSPDGRDLIFDLPVSEATDDRDIMLVAVDGSRGLTVIEHPSQDIVMGWTPDGSALLFASDRGGSMGLWSQSFGERRPQGAPRLIRGGLGGFTSAGVTRSGALYFAVNSSERDIWTTAVDLAAGKAGPPARPIQQFVGTNMMPDWSADGRFLAYVSQRGGGRSNAGRVIGVRDMNTGDERALRPALTYFGPLDWAPDGASFVTAGTDLKGREGVFRIDAKTAEVSLVVENTIDAYPKWSPDGKHVFYRKGAWQQSADISIVERDLSSGAERTVASGELGVFSVSPDGRTIAAPVGGIAGGAASVVTLVRVDSGEMRDLMRVGPAERFPPYIAPRWTPDGRAVLVRKRTPNELWLAPTTGAPARKLDVDVRDWSFGAVGQIGIHPDGRQVAFLSGNLSSEVMVLENFLPKASATR